MDQTSPPAVIGGPCAPLEVCHATPKGLVWIASNPLPQGTYTTVPLLASPPSESLPHAAMCGGLLMPPRSDWFNK